VLVAAAATTLCERDDHRKEYERMKMHKIKNEMAKLETAYLLNSLCVFCKSEMEFREFLNQLVEKMCGISFYCMT
jgi:hypothetical protein